VTNSASYKDPLFNSHQFQDNTPLYFISTDRKKIAIIQHGFKFIYSLPGSCLLQNAQKELYSLGKDPEEKNNLINTEIPMAKLLGKELLSYVKQKKILNTKDISTDELPIQTDVEKDIIKHLNYLGY